MSSRPNNFGRQVNDMVNNLEAITYYKHHYVRKTGLKKAIKILCEEEIKKAMKNHQNCIQPKSWADSDPSKNNRIDC